ncbi:MAG: lysophospholipid acyltransferase family protein [Myxococcota bacterium]|nr:lysophospholipid acyltransferase family protein [Myxococcota bacterium]
MKNFFYTCLAWLAALLMMIVRSTCRLRTINDCRPDIVAAKKNYIYAAMHGKIMHAMFTVQEKKLCVMVSHSTDGALVVPFLKCLGFFTVRGSSRKGNQDKGGASALAQLITWCQNGGTAGLTIDGPRGPRGVVQPGIVKLAQATNTLIVPISGQASRAWIFHRSWDRFELPKPFSSVELTYGQPFDVSAYPDTKSACAALSKILLDMAE